MKATSPIDWAKTQNNLGIALAALGERESGTQHLTDAVAVFRAALQERTQARVPLDWAGTQVNLGNALRILGTRTHDTNQLCEALADEVNAWQVFTGTASYYTSMAVAVTKWTWMRCTRKSMKRLPRACRPNPTDLNRMGVTN